MADIGLAASVIAVIQLTTSCLKLSRKLIGPSEFGLSELATMTTVLYAFNGAMKTFETHLEIYEDNEARLSSLEYLKIALHRCNQALDVIKEFMERPGAMMNRFIVGPRFDRKLKSSLKVLEEAKELFNLSVHADQQSILLGVDSYIRNVAQDIRDIQIVIRHNEVQLDEVHENQKAQALDKERQEILDWLSPLDYALQQSDNINRRQPGTGQWFLDSTVFKNWLDTSSNRKTVLCLGIPGAGKTILTSTVVQYLQKRYDSDTDVGLAYIYLNFRRQDEQRPEDLLASLLKQLCQCQPHLPHSAKSLYDYHKKHRTRPSFDEISVALHSTVSDSTRYSRVFILADALDECQTADGYQSLFLNALASLQKRCAANIFMTSRFAPDDIHEFRGAETVEIRASTSDVQDYLSGQMFRLPRVVRQNPELREEVKAEITSAAEGMFLLAQLHLDSLVGKRCIKSVRATLRSLPRGSGSYDKSYEKTMERVKSQDSDTAELARRILSWIVCTKRPLTTAELQQALAVEKGTCELDEANLHPIEDMVSICAGLVTVDEHSNIIRLVHYTTQEYFERIRQDWFPQTDTEIVTTCLTYLSFSAFESGACSTDDEFEDRLKRYPLYSYAAHNWAYHARKDITGSKLVSEFLRSDNLVQATSQATAFDTTRWRRGYSQRVPNKVTGLHLAARYGLDEIVESLIAHIGNVDLDDGDGRTPLSYACGRGQTELAKLLLANGANAASKARDGSMPLHYAARKGYTAVAVALLASGAQVDAKDMLRRTPLQYAVKNGYVGVAKILLGKGADVETMDSWGWTPLIHAAEGAHENSARLILAMGASPDSKSDRNRTALSYAAGKGHRNIIHWLLESGATVDYKDNQGRTPLTYGAENGHEAAVQLLLRHGAQADLTSASRRTPLSYSTRKGDVGVAKMLLSKEALGLGDSDGDPPLCYAAMYGHEAMLRYLIESGGDVNAKSKNGRSPLSHAAFNGHANVVKVLIQEYPIDDINQEDEWGQTPLFLAARQGHDNVVKTLLNWKVKVDPKDNVLGQTPLSHAAQNGYLPVVKLLVENGADPLSEDMFGETPVDYASAMKETAVLEFLRQYTK